MKKIIFSLFFIFVLFIVFIFFGLSEKNIAEDQRMKYADLFPVGASMSEVKSYLIQSDISFSIEEKKDFTDLSKKYMRNGYSSVVIFNAVTNRNIFSKSDILVEVGFDANNEVIEVTTEQVNTLL